jgi:chemotaxis protein methyltransferase CheR
MSSGQSINNKQGQYGVLAINALIETMRQCHGLDISFYDETFLEQSLRKRVACLSGDIWEDYHSRLAADSTEARMLLRSLSIGYTEFFRNPLTFALLERFALPDLIREKTKTRQKEIRVWSAGCASGEEAWSVAILLDELSSAATDGATPFRIIATDNSADALAAAKAGVYDAASMQNVRLRHLGEYFIRQGGSYRVISRLIERVDFSAYDLRDEQAGSPPASLFGDFDLVLCCNLLFYFREPVREHMLEKICRVLTPGGYLVTGEAECDMVRKIRGFNMVVPGGTVFQKRREL